MDYSDDCTMEKLFIEPASLNAQHLLSMCPKGGSSVARKVSSKKPAGANQPPSEVQVPLNAASKEWLERVLQLMGVGMQHSPSADTPHVDEKVLERVIRLLQADGKLMAMFSIQGHSKGFINLSRTQPAKCLLSGKMHARRPAFVTFHNFM